MHEPIIIALDGEEKCAECGKDTFIYCDECSYLTCPECCERLSLEAREAERDREFDEKCALGYL